MVACAWIGVSAASLEGMPARPDDTRTPATSLACRDWRRVNNLRLL